MYDRRSETPPHRRKDTTQLPQAAAPLALSVLVANAKRETIRKRHSPLDTNNKQLLGRNTAYFDPEATENSHRRILRKGHSVAEA